VIVAAFALCACGASEDPGEIELTHDACSPLSLVATAPTDAQSAALRGGQQVGTEAGVPALGQVGATIEVRFDSSNPAIRGLYDDKTGVIYINSELKDPRVLSIVVAHELGHAFGLVHVPESERKSLMNPGNIATPPTVEDQAALAALWGTCE